LFIKLGFSEKDQSLTKITRKEKVEVTDKHKMIEIFFNLMVIAS